LRDTVADAADKDGVVGTPARHARRYTLAVRGIDKILPPAFQHRVDGNQPPFVEDPHFAGQLMDLDNTACAVGNRVVVAADRDQPVMADTAFELE